MSQSERALHGLVVASTEQGTEAHSGWRAAWPQLINRQSAAVLRNKGKDNSPLGHQSREIEGLVYFAQARCLLLVITRLASDSDCRDAARYQAKASSRMKKKKTARDSGVEDGIVAFGQKCMAKFSLRQQKIEGVKLPGRDTFRPTRRMSGTF